VCLVFFLETVQTGLSGADVYYWFVSGFGDRRHLNSPYAAAFDVPIIESVVSLIVEFFFAHRIWALGVRWSKLFCLLICLVGQSQARLESSRSSLVHFLSAPFLMQQRRSPVAFM
jgi:hypothetical protein